MLPVKLDLENSASTEAKLETIWKFLIKGKTADLETFPVATRQKKSSEEEDQKRAYYKKFSL